MLEGPTADAYVMLFVAAESILDSRQPSKREFDALLTEVGLDPDDLPFHTGRLIRLRGKIVHEGLDDHPDLRVAYYEMEAIVRILIRKAADLPGGWWPTPGPAAYADPWAERVFKADRPRTVWHDRGLPPVQLPTSGERLPRRLLASSQPLVVQLDFTDESIDDDTCEVVSAIVSDAHAWVDPDGPPVIVTLETVDRGRPNGIVFNRERLHIPPERLRYVLDETRPERFINLVWDLQGAVAGTAAMRRGVPSDGDGVAVIEAAGALHQYLRVATVDAFDPTQLTLPPVSSTDPAQVGKLVGWAVAGDSRAKLQLSRMSRNARELADKLTALLQEFPLFPPRPAL